MTLKQKGNDGREVIVEFQGQKFARYPVETHFVEIGEKLEDILDKYAKPNLKAGDVLGIATKIVSITTGGLTVHKDKVRITPLAKLITRFVKKWPNDIGYSSPRKMQVAINRAGYPRIIVALLAGIFMKLIGKPGYFYRVAGNQINAIDGFTVGFTDKQIFADYAFLPPRPEQGRKMCNDLEAKYEVGVVFLDGNNIENNIISIGEQAEKMYSPPDLMSILQGNPQGQEDDGNNTPILIVRKV